MDFGQVKINEIVELLGWKGHPYAFALEDAGYGTVLSVFAHPDALIASRTGMSLDDVKKFKENLPTNGLDLDY